MNKSASDNQVAKPVEQLNNFDRHHPNNNDAVDFDFNRWSQQVRPQLLAALRKREAGFE
jgi:hypothetical protein